MPEVCIIVVCSLVSNDAASLEATLKINVR